MQYAEASYFDGYYFQHIAAYFEYLRLLTKQQRLARLRLHYGNRAT